jgi:hypothetical protein
MRFGVPAQVVVEIVRAVAVTPISGAPDVVQGLIDYRGTIVPVFDVARRMRGDIVVESLLGKGSTFALRLPLAAREATAVSAS